MNRMYRISDEKIKGVSDREIMARFPDVWVYTEKPNYFHSKFIVERERNSVGGHEGICFIYYRSKEVVEARNKADRESGKHQEVIDYFVNELGYKYKPDIWADPVADSSNYFGDEEEDYVNNDECNYVVFDFDECEMQCFEYEDDAIKFCERNAYAQTVIDFNGNIVWEKGSGRVVSDSRKISDADVIGDIYMHCEKMSGDKEMLSQYLDKQYFKYGMITYPEYEMICEDYDIKPHKRGF
jgi:hypothetical protein